MPQTDKKAAQGSPAISKDELYAELFLRNKGYISDELQQKIRNTRLLIAGCGVGSAFAEAAVRVGFENITLIDGDTVSVSNLNRQTFTYADVDTPKVTALANRLRAINPNVAINELNDWITVKNAEALVAGADMIFETIDFLDIVAITAIHDEANRQKKPIISAVSAGWGAVAVYFPPSDSDVSVFRKIFGLNDYGSVENASYVVHFAHLINRIADDLDPALANAMGKALTIMKDGTPCPAPHLSVGSFSVASLAVTIATRILNGEEVTHAPQMIVASMSEIAAGRTSKSILL